MLLRERKSDRGDKSHTLVNGYKKLSICLLNIGLAIVIGLSVSGGLVLTAHAASQTVNNSNASTGNSSVNTNIQSASDNNNINSTDTSNSSTNVNFTIDTGNNTISNNTSVGNVSVGGVTSQIQVANTANNQPINLTASATNIIATGSNSETGQNSTNINTTNINNSVHIVRNQLATISNQIATSVKSGGNTITNNTQVGNITIGPVQLSTTIVNTANSIPLSPSNNNGGMGGGSSAPIGSNQITTALAVYNPVPTTTTASEFFPSGGDGLVGIYLIAAIVALGFLPGTSLAKRLVAPITLVSGRPVLGTGLTLQPKIKKSQKHPKEQV